MLKLRAYLKSLSPADREAFAVACGTSVGYLYKATFVNARLGPELSVCIEEHSGGAVTRKDLHVNWARIWPELAQRAA